MRRSEDGAARDAQDADGIFVRHLPSPLLADVNIVDTPGTNVILERQQRLTEEFVPRSDLVLFCMSAGAPPARRPCTVPRHVHVESPGVWPMLFLYPAQQEVHASVTSRVQTLDPDAHAGAAADRPFRRARRTPAQGT